MYNYIYSYVYIYIHISFYDIHENVLFKFPSLKIRISDETNVILSNQTDHGTSLLFRESQKSLGRI